MKLQGFHIIKNARLLKERWICFALLLLSGLFIHAQDCPPNIDFERGDFTGWRCHIGQVAQSGNDNIISLYDVGGPVTDQHTMFSLNSAAGLVDYYGGFPVLCPNGSRYSVKLGNTNGGAQAEGISYEFTIPAGQNTYSLTYHYAVVFQDPSHQPHQQPRLVLEVTNVTDNELINCSSFTFFPNGSPLPGFFQSPRSDSIAVWCKDWSPVSINLNNQAGKTIRLFFKTADCVFVRHFGYAYIDVNTGCNSEFTGAVYCPDDTAVSVTAPYGYQNYTWYNNTFTQVLGTQQTINFVPPPATGTTIAVALTPYDGYGCPDTLYAKLIDTLSLKAKAGADQVSCNKAPVFIGDIPQPGINYSWDPPTGLSNSYVANPRAGPDITTQYILTIRSNGGGCVNTDTVIVIASIVDTALLLEGKREFCITSGDSAVLAVQPATLIQWTLNSNNISGATQPRYYVTQSGDYFASIMNNDGCIARTRTETILIESPRAGIRYPVQYAIIDIPVQLQARTFGASVLWKPSSYLDNAANVTPAFNATFELEQLYTIDIITAAGCMTVDTQQVVVIKEVKVYVPTAFTPNNDGLNDFLKPIMMGIKDLQYFRIYHRGGQMVYDYNNNSRGWDGKIGGILQTTGVYVWLFSGIGWDKQLHFKKGTLTLIR